MHHPCITALENELALWPSRNSVVGLTRLVEPKLQLPGAVAAELRKAVA